MGYYLTRYAHFDLEQAYQYSLANWGERVALSYLDEIYEIINIISRNPKLIQRRQAVCYPFFITRAAKHHVVYEVYEKDIVVVAVIQAKRDVDKVLSRMETLLIDEVKEIKQRIKNKH